MRDIVILHGWGSRSENWSKAREGFEKEGFRVFAPDLPGFGKEPPPPEPWSLNDYSEWFENYCRKNDLSQFFLLAHSFGGRIALKFAARKKDSLSALVLVSPGGAESADVLRNLKKEILGKVAPFSRKLCFLPGYEALRKFFYKIVLRQTDYLQALGVMRETFKKVVVENLIPILPEIKTKTLLVWGRNDNFLPVKEGILMDGKIPDSKLEILEGVGHNPHSQCPEKLVLIVSNWLKSI